jgi:hypothetical protein
VPDLLPAEGSVPGAGPVVVGLEAPVAVAPGVTGVPVVPPGRVVVPAGAVEPRPGCR